MSILNILRKKSGMSPGSLVFTGNQKVAETKIDVFIYKPDSIIEKQAVDLDELKKIKDKDNVVWINICGLHETDKLGEIGKIFNVHPLIMEDILNINHSPKLEEYEDYLFLIAKRMDYDNGLKVIDAEQVSFILGKGYLLTFQEKEGDEFNIIRERLRDGTGRLRKLGADYLMYRLLDSIVDNYTVILFQLDENYEEIEDELLDNPDQSTIEAIHSFRKQNNKFRRSVTPLKEVIYSIEKDVHPLIQKSNLIFIKDLGDHIKSAIDAIENYREQVNGMIEVYRSSSGLKLNEIVKVLTIISTIFIPLTFIAGLYGMNFSYRSSPYNMPELSWYYGYPTVLGIMLLIAIGLLLIFKKKQWI
jgi:magnesium transporter